MLLRELLTRTECRESYEAFCYLALEPYGQKPAAHHRLIIKELQAIADGENDRLLLFLPPGSAKSTYASILFPAWYLARKMTAAIIAASHTAMLAENFSRRVRATVRDHSITLGVNVASEAVELWSTTEGGQYRAVGVGGAITGFRADCAICDDLVKSRANADSETYREHTWDWWQNDLTTRLKPGAPVVCIGTRWHQDDIYGRLLERQPGQWRVLSIPAIADSPNDPLGRRPGEALWADDAYGYAADLAVKKRSLDGRTFSALFQQNPVPDSGDYFRAEWLRPVATLPPASSMRMFMGSDYAVTAGGGDYTVHAVVGLDSDNRLYLCDVWREQTSSDVWVDAFCALVLQWRPMGAAEETGQIKSAIGPWLDKRQREKRAFVARSQFPTRGGDKAVRAQSIRGRIASGGLYIPVDAPWRGEVEAEMMAFPAGKHDDFVDAIALVGQLIDQMFPPPKTKAEKGPVDTWARAFAGSNAGGGDSWKTA